MLCVLCTPTQVYLQKNLVCSVIHTPTTAIHATYKCINSIKYFMLVWISVKAQVKFCVCVLVCGCNYIKHPEEMQHNSTKFFSTSWPMKKAFIPSENILDGILLLKKMYYREKYVIFFSSTADFWSPIMSLLYFLLLLFSV